MELIVLIVHLLVSLCLIGLVLLQRSEGGALGMGGGGGGGSLMSGRGAADALAKMTSVAGGFFLVTSLSLTVLSGAAANATGGNSIFDALRSQPAPAVAPAPAQPEQTRPDPTESSAPEASDTRLASIMPGPGEASAAEPASSTRAGPIAASATPPRTQPATVQRTATNPPPRQPAATQRSGAAATVPASANSTAPTTARATPPPATARSGAGTTPANTGASRPLVIPNTSGSGVNGIELADDPTRPTESIEIGNGVEAVRRERAGPDQ